MLLPLALASVEDADGLTQLTQVVVARPERGTRRHAAGGPQGATDGQRLSGTPAVVAALRSLAASDDAAFTAKVGKVLAAVAPDGVEAPAAVGDPSMGLWDLPPMLGGTGTDRHWPHWGPPPRWDEALDVRYPYAARVQPWLIGVSLSAMADGTFGDGSELRAAATERLSQQRLSTTMLSRTFEDLFLAGGLRQGWPVALDLVDAVCGATTRPPGLADLLRTLHRYAAEVPDRDTVPPGLAALALSPGTSKAQSEARRLVATLSGLPEDESIAALVDQARVPELSRPTGLWAAMIVPEDPLPSEVTVGDDDDPILAAGHDLTALRELLSQDFNGYAQSFQDICHWPPGYAASRSTTGLTEPDRVLGATLAAIQRHGVAEVRAALSGIERYYKPLDVILAIDCWVAGALDRATFWRVAQRPLGRGVRTVPAVASEGDRTRGGERTTGRSALLRRAATTSRRPETDALVVPSEMATPIERFAFLRAAELLMLADAPFLAAPTWADGTLDVDIFLARLAQAALGPGALVGPLDLVQALHRLRPADPAAATEVPLGLRTAPAFTDPAGQDSWDASGLVSHWLAEGRTARPGGRDGRIVAGGRPRP